MKEVVCDMLATIKEEIGSILKNKLRLLKRETKEETESNTKAAADKVLEKVHQHRFLDTLSPSLPII